MVEASIPVYNGLPLLTACIGSLHISSVSHVPGIPGDKPYSFQTHADTAFVVPW